MRVALVHPYTWPRTRRGGERYLHDLGGYLARRGFDVTILAGTDGTDGPPAEVIDGCRVRRVWTRPGPALRRIPLFVRHRLERDRIAAVLRRAEFDVVHAFSPPAAEAAARAGHRTLYTMLGAPTARDRVTARGLLASVRRASDAADGRAALSEAARRHALELFGRDWFVLPPGVHTSRFAPDLRPRSGAPRLLFSAALDVRYKGLADVLAAFALVLEQHPDATLTLSGPGRHSWALDQLRPREAAVVAGRLIVAGTGELDSADLRYRDATVTVLPSRNEAFGLSVVESLAAGTPVVVGDDGGPADIVGGARVGQIVPTGDPAALARGILEADELGREPSSPRRCVARARTWDWSAHVGPQHESAYERLVSRTGTATRMGT